MVDKLDHRKDGVTISNPEKVICWEELSQYTEHVNACKNNKIDSIHPKYSKGKFSYTLCRYDVSERILNRSGSI